MSTIKSTFACSKKMTFIEHNNRNIAKKFAEYITGEELRKYCKNKIEKYLGSQDITVTEGRRSAGSVGWVCPLIYPKNKNSL